MKRRIAGWISLAFLLGFVPNHSLAKVSAKEMPPPDWIRGHAACSAGNLKIDLEVRTMRKVVESPLSIRISQSDKNISAQGAKGFIQLLSGTKAWINLHPQPEGHLIGYGKFQYDPGLELEFSLDLPGHGQIQGRISPFHTSTGAPPCYAK